MHAQYGNVTHDDVVCRLHTHETHWNGSGVPVGFAIHLTSSLSIGRGRQVSSFVVALSILTYRVATRFDLLDSGQAQAVRFLSRDAKSPANPEPNNSAAAGRGTAASWAVPFNVNWSESRFHPVGRPASPLKLRVQLRPVNASVVSLKVPVALPPTLSDTPAEGSSGPVSLAPSAVKSAVMVEPLVLLVGTGFGPPVNKEKV